MVRALRYLLLVGGPIICILLFLLVTASDNSAAFEKNYPWLLGLNALFAFALLISVISLVIRLYRNYRQKQFGSRLMARLVLLFAVIGVLPGTVIYLVSVQFVYHSIESWFDVSVESALDSGLKLGQSALESQLNDLLAKGRSVALEISDLPPVGQATQLTKLYESNPTLEATVVTANGRVLAGAGNLVAGQAPDLPTAAMIKQARLTRGYSALESRDNAADGSNSGDLHMRVIIAIPPSNAEWTGQEARFLQLLQPIPSSLAVNAKALSDTSREYHERSLGRTGLRKIYIETLTLTLLLATFCAIAAGFVIASNLAKPLLLLAEGTKAVAEGNLSPRPIVASSDELGTLTQSFDTMTRQLADARASVELNRTALENAKAYLESVLANMSAGVMVLDSHFVLVSCNESVERILQHGFEADLGKPLSEIEELKAFCAAIDQAFSNQSAHTAADHSEGMRGHWQRQIELPHTGPGGEESGGSTTILARGSRLPVGDDTGYLVVFDDISDVISAQRAFAWGEVARRLAHEIKNPLTPIQLSAERMQMKLTGKLMATDAAILEKGTSTIVNQVSAMKRMVDDFRDYAKAPPAVLSPLDLNSLVEEILHLYLAGDGRDVIHATLAPHLPPIMGDETQLRQVIHNLLQNAQDAVGDHPERPANIELRTEAIRYKGSNEETRTAVRLTIADNGPGFSAKILSRAFEPYVTSKPRGTGLGLAMVKKIIEEHGGRIDIQNRSDANGAKVAILLLKLAPVE